MYQETSGSNQESTVSGSLSHEMSQEDSNELTLPTSFPGSPVLKIQKSIRIEESFSETKNIGVVKSESKENQTYTWEVDFGPDKTEIGSDGAES